MFDFDLDQYDEKSIETFQKTGGRLPKGRYHVTLYGVKPHTAKSNSTGTELTFRVIAGPCAGMDISEIIWDSETDAGRRRAILFGSRLGLLVRKQGGSGWALAPGKHDFGDCIGTDCVIEVQDETFTRKDNSTGTKSRVSFNGIWPTNDPEVRSVPKAKPGTTPAPAPARRAVDAAEL